MDGLRRFTLSLGVAGMLLAPGGGAGSDHAAHRHRRRRRLHRRGADRCSAARGRRSSTRLAIPPEVRARTLADGVSAARSRGRADLSWRHDLRLAALGRGPARGTVRSARDAARWPDGGVRRAARSSGPWASRRRPATPASCTSTPMAFPTPWSSTSGTVGYGGSSGRSLRPTEPRASERADQLPDLRSVSIRSSTRSTSRPSRII